MRRMIALGIERRRKRKNLRGTEFHAETAGLATLYNDINLTFSHCIPHSRELGNSLRLWVIMPVILTNPCDQDHICECATARISTQEPRDDSHRGIL